MIAKKILLLFIIQLSLFCNKKEKKNISLEICSINSYPKIIEKLKFNLNDEIIYYESDSENTNKKLFFVILLNDDRIFLNEFINYFLSNKIVKRCNDLNNEFTIDGSTLISFSIFENDKQVYLTAYNNCDFEQTTILIKLNKLINNIRNSKNKSLFFKKFCEPSKPPI